jgi:hypothetical protein
MRAERAYLTAVMTNRNGKTVWSGEYACSICDLRFRADPADAGKLSREYEAHKAQHHAASEPGDSRRSDAPIAKTTGRSGK